MRQLHPVSFNEKFVASGVYTLYAGNLPTGDVEYWSMHEPGEGSCTIRADRDGRGGSGENWIFEGLVVDGRIERFDMEILGANTATAKFMFDDSGVEVSQRVNGETRETMQISLPQGYAISPPALAAQWLFAPMSVGKTAQVWIPNLDVVDGQFLGGYTLEWNTDAAGEAIHPIGEVHSECSEFRLLSGMASVNLCVDAHGILMRLDADSGETALLTQYVRRPDR